MDFLWRGVAAAVTAGRRSRSSRVRSYRLPHISSESLKRVILNQVGVEFEVDDDISYVASIDEENLWVSDPGREFADSREYTILGKSCWSNSTKREMGLHRHSANWDDRVR